MHAPPKRAASKLGREGKTAGVLGSWSVWGVWDAFDIAIPTRSTGSDGQKMTPGTAACDLSDIPKEMGWALKSGE